MNYNFQGDVLLSATEDGGEIEFDDHDLIVADDGFNTSAYLTLFGGNYNDNGTTSTKKYEYWGNKLDKDNPERWLVSRTQNIINGLPATSENVLKLKEAIELDMNWYLTEKIIDTLDITITLPQLNRVKIELLGLKDKKTIFNLKYNKLWLAKLG